MDAGRPYERGGEQQAKTERTPQNEMNSSTKFRNEPTTAAVGRKYEPNYTCLRVHHAVTSRFILDAFCWGQEDRKPQISEWISVISCLRRTGMPEGARNAIIDGATRGARADLIGPLDIQQRVSKRNAARDQVVLIGLALKGLLKVGMGDGNERPGTLGD
jgi:hypothetical protein